MAQFLQRLEEEARSLLEQLHGSLHDERSAAQSQLDVACTANQLQLDLANRRKLHSRLIDAAGQIREHTTTAAHSESAK